MKKILITLIIVFSVFKINAQSIPGYLLDRVNTSDTTYEWYWPFDVNKSVIMKAKDSTLVSFKFNNIKFDSLNSRRDNGTPTSIVWLSDNGTIQKGKVSALVTLISPSITPTASNVIGLALVAISGNYTSLTGRPVIPPSITLTTSGTSGVSTYNNGSLNIPNYATGIGTVTSVGLSSSDFSISGSPVTSNGNITINQNTSGVTAGSYIGQITVNNKGIVTVGSNPTITIIPNTSIAFGTAYQISSNRYSNVNLSFSTSCSLSLSGGQSGEVYLEYSANGSTNWLFAGEQSSSNTGSLTIGLNTVQLSGGQLTCLLPPGYYFRLRTNNVTGTPTYTFLGGIQIIY